jgi:hypothetical protein
MYQRQVPLAPSFNDDNNKGERLKPYWYNRRWGALLLVPAILAVFIMLEGCGGSDDESGPIVPIPGASASMTYGTPAADIAAALGCTGLHPTESPDPDSSEIDLGGAAPTEELRCTLDGKPVSIVTWDEPAQQATALAVMKSVFEGFSGFEFYLARGDGWVAVNEGDVEDFEDSGKLTAEKIARVLDGEVLHWEADE